MELSLNNLLLGVGSALLLFIFVSRVTEWLYLRWRLNGLRRRLQKGATSATELDEMRTTVFFVRLHAGKAAGIRKVCTEIEREVLVRSRGLQLMRGGPDELLAPVQEIFSPSAPDQSKTTVL